MSTMLIAWNATRESGSFCGDQLCSLKAAYLFVQSESDVDKLIVALSRKNEMHFLLEKFLDDPRGDGSKVGVEVIWDDWNPGNWTERHTAWDKWRKDRSIEGRQFDHYRELYLRIHGASRQGVLCGGERGLGRRNIYSYWYCGQEHSPDELPPSVDWFDDTLIYHPIPTPERDVYISPHAKTQGNAVFTFQFWDDVVRRLVDAGVSVTVGYDGYACEDLVGDPLFKKHWGNHHQWMEEVCRHKLVACGNTGTGWLAAACGVPMITMEPHNSMMADHRFRECGLRNIVEVVDGHKLDEMDNDMRRAADYVARRIASIVGKSHRYEEMKSIGAVLTTASHYSVNPVTKLRLMAQQLLSVKWLPGDIADLGTMRGGTAYVMRKLAPEKHLHVFDTWEGTPYDDPLCHHKKGEWVASLQECQKLVGNSDLTIYHKGVFPDPRHQVTSLRVIGEFCFVYIDMDTEQATKDAIAFFWPRLVPGGKLLFDDWRWDACAGVEKVVREVFSNDQIEEFPSLYSCVVTKP